MSETWFVTGASSGIGQAIVEKLLLNEAIATVIAAVRTPSSLHFASNDAKLQIVPFPFDLTDDATIEATFTWVDSTFGKIDYFVGCAGIGGDLSEIEGLPREVIDSTFRVNLFGSFRAVQCAVEKFRLKGGFKIFQITSEVGVHPFPGTGWYGASKAGEIQKSVYDCRLILEALENLMGTYSQELVPDWKIKIHLIALGAYATRMAANITEYPTHPEYTGSHMETIIRPMCWNLVRPPAAQAAEDILAVVRRDNLPLHILVGQDSAMLAEAEKADLEEALVFYKEGQNEGVD